MKKEIEEQFAALFSAHANKVEQRREAKAATETKEQEFVRTFREHCARSLKPALEQIAQHLGTKGMKTRIDEAYEQVGMHGGQSERTGLTIHLLMGEEGRHYASHEQPHLSLHPDKHRQLVTLIQSTIRPGAGGTSGSIGEFNLAQLTGEFLQQKVYELVAEVLK